MIPFCRSCKNDFLCFEMSFLKKSSIYYTGPIFFLVYSSSLLFIDTSIHMFMYISQKSIICFRETLKLSKYDMVLLGKVERNTYCKSHLFAAKE